MNLDSPPQIIRHDSQYGRWELAQAAPHPALQGVVLRMQGYIEEVTSFAARLETPNPDIVLIINLGPALRIETLETGGAVEIGSFLAGLHDRSVLVGARGPMRCIQIDLTPLGAARLLRTPMHELVNRTLALDDLIGGESRRLEAQLDETPGWAARFAILEAALLRRLARTPPEPAELGWAVRRMQETGGAIPVSTLAEEIGWSRKHLAQRFRERIGLPPKPYARVVRFRRAVEELHTGQGADLAAVALASGYFDQAHFNRDFRALAGVTPSDYLRRLTADAGVIGD